MKIEPFAMERIQSTWQHVVEYDLSHSGVTPLRIRDLLGTRPRVAEFVNIRAAYGPTNGSQELREAIAALYPGASADNVLVTSGSSEANFLVMWHLARSKGSLLHAIPSYLQIWGLARTFRLRVRPLPLDPGSGWQFDPEHLKDAMSRDLVAVAVCNPNNPTGTVFDRTRRRALLDAVRDSHVWLVSDEVFQGAEREGSDTESLWHPDRRTIVTSGLSKAYGLPGLRIGWIVGPEDLILALWGHHDYTTIGPALLSDRLARIALEPRRRRSILARTRSIIRTNYRSLERWVRTLGMSLSFVPPVAGPICFLRPAFPFESEEFARRLIKERSTLVVPGVHFGLEGYFRLCFGATRGYLAGGLSRIAAALIDLESETRAQAA